MNVQKTKKQSIIKNIMQVAPKHCENCGSKYSSDDFQVMKSNPQNALLHLKCKVCKNIYILNVINQMSGMFGVNRLRLNLDLDSADEFSKFAGSPPMSEDIALDIYEQTDPEHFTVLLKSLQEQGE